MKTIGWSRTATRCVTVAIFLLLASLRFVSAQIIDPIDPVVGPVPRIISPANHAVFYAPADIPILDRKSVV